MPSSGSVTMQDSILVCLTSPHRCRRPISSTRSETLAQFRETEEFNSLNTIVLIEVSRVVLLILPVGEIWSRAPRLRTSYEEISGSSCSFQAQYLAILAPATNSAATDSRKITGRSIVPCIAKCRTHPVRLSISVAARLWLRTPCLGLLLGILGGSLACNESTSR
ncbi:hypothetical protein BO86DRAFT_74446 [Aspergillus japonicus CBS 114.51]|uniref:Uncharacterized protein n=1 Tax=Aspergillus japonicus CBS 114.51 TaxID=1448312 RepID=A0A8T8XFZ7_ASPJA|nr:hypothetical protein BO86DRAFT_74446 [Aspergillus japonicus CBS 114.51]RAH86941.1 hypothetical protein BO86DRAFT_74446 [Aspergillus japonicus CBS 114.51]